MEKEKLESLIIDFIDNKLNSVDRHFVEQELMRNAEAYKLYEQLKEVMHVMDRAARLEPSLKLKNDFDKALVQEIENSKKSKTVFFTPTFYRVAAAIALAVVGVSLGFWIQNYNEQKKQLARIEKEMEDTRRLMRGLLENQLSASQRMQGVTVAMTVDKVDKQIVNALYKTMTEDANSNVRLAALEALEKFSSDVTVRRMLISSLSVQKDPVVQIALIQILVKLNEKSVVNDLQKIVDDVETMQAVKDEAYSGILKLS
jgi:hypothetical protein